MPVKPRYIYFSFLAVPIAAIGYLVERDQSWALFALFAIAFAAYFILVIKRDSTLKELLVAGIMLRLMLIGVSPELSDDYYRFAFDGDMLIHGENPYLVFPDSLENPTEYQAMLVEEMNSPKYYTVYPPINQIFFSVPSLIAGDNIVVYTFVLRILIVLFEILMALLLLKMLQFLKKDLKLFAWYFLNPLVVIELSGNLHFEGVTMFFMLLAFYMLMIGKFWRSAVVYAVAIGTKLIPLILLPFFFKRLKMKAFVYYSVIGLMTVVLFLPFINTELIANMSSSIQLYFDDFMFNGSILYLVNDITMTFTGYEYNLEVLGNVFQGVVLIAVVLMSLFEKKPDWNSLIQKGLFALLIYYSVAAIVHPWYVINLVALSLFTNYKFPYVWSALALLSYSAYNGDGSVTEHPLILIIEYVLLFGMVIFEMIYYRKVKKVAETPAIQS
ncbi:MAG: alpha-1,6-mannosyltransferase [Parvicellaceae bacterium]|jgi:alpha-1,6-mannosyltransferase